MLLKKIAIGAATCLALFGMVPNSGFAVSAVELQASSHGAVLGAVTYSTVTVTSPTNQTITITVTPVSYDGSNWTYQLSWNRVRNAQGSIYVSLKSDITQKVLSVDTANQVASATFVAAPSTNYRVEFYSAPSAGGTLLVRKYFTTLASQSATTASNTTATTSNSTTGSSSSLLTIPTQTQTTTGARVGQLVYNSGNRTVYMVGNSGLYGFTDAATFYSWGFTFSQVVAENSAEQTLSMVGTVPTMQSGCSSPLNQIAGTCGSTTSNIPLPPSQSSPQYLGVLKGLTDVDVTKYDYLGTNVGAGIAGSTSGSCSLDTSWESASPTSYGNNGFTQAICNNARTSFVYSIDYKDANNTCFHWDYTGKYQFDCTVLTGLLGYAPATLATVPTSGSDTSLQNRDYNAQCYFAAVDGNLLTGYNGICGGLASTSLPTASQMTTAINNYNPNSSVPSQQSQLVGLLKNASDVDVTKYDYLGTNVGAGIAGSLGGSCSYDTSWESASPTTYGNNGFTQAICNNATKFFVYSIDYKDAGGTCYHWDYTGKYQMDCTVLTGLLGYAPATLSSVPTSGFDATLQDRDYNAKCYFAAVDGNSLTGYDGGCGVNTHNPSQQMPTASQVTTAINNYNPNSSVPSQSSPQYLGVLKGLTAVDVTKYDYLGTNVGSGIAGSLGGSCSYDKSYLNANAAEYGGDLAQVICNHARTFFVYSIDYKDTGGICYHWDYTGKYQMDCTVLSGLLGYAPATLATVPTSGSDTSLQNRDYNAQCYFAAVDGNLLTGYNGICGGLASTSLPTASQMTTAINNYNPNSSVPSQQSQLVGLLKNASDVDVTKYDYLGTNVGAGIAGSLGGSCSYDTSWESASPTTYGNNGFTQAICNNATKFFVYSIDYKDAGGTCYHWDYTGKYQMDCTVLTGLLGYAPATLSSVPTSGFDATLQDRDYNAKCYFAAVDGNSLTGYDGGCGVNTHSPSQQMPTADQLTNAANVANTRENRNPTTTSNTTVSSSFPAGCSSTTGYSSTTGQSCSVSISLPAGCTSTTGYSPTTGKSCSSN